MCELLQSNASGTTQDTLSLASACRARSLRLFSIHSRCVVGGADSTGSGGDDRRHSTAFLRDSSDGSDAARNSDTRCSVALETTGTPVLVPLFARSNTQIRAPIAKDTFAKTDVVAMSRVARIRLAPREHTS
jgi:hypothetical protein